MALECTQCGHRCDDDATRCPKCLRTQLLAVADAPPPSKKMPAAVLAIFALAGLTATFAVLHSRDRPAASSGPALPQGAPASAQDPLAAGPELAPLVARLRGIPDATARARAAGEAVTQRRRAGLLGEDEVIPPPRAPDLVWRLLPSATERFTELDLARLVTAVLRAAGDPEARVAERLAGSRPDVPADPTGSLGSYGVKVGAHLLDVATGTLLAASDAPHHALDDAMVSAAVSSQSGIELATTGGGRDRAVQYATAAVQASRDAPTALAARARVWIEAGGSGGINLAEADLQAAVSQRDDPALQLLRARVLLLGGRVGEAALAASRASQRAPGWGTAALAVIALRDALRALDAGARDGCASLSAARATWTDDAYALCAEGTPAAVRASAAQRLLEGSRDPLRVAWAASAMDAGALRGLRGRVRATQREELARWLLLLRRPDLAELVSDAPDAGR